MEKIGRVKDLKRGESINFHYEGKEGILVKTKKGKLVAYGQDLPPRRRHHCLGCRY